MYEIFILSEKGSMFENEVGDKGNISFKDELIDDIQKLSQN